MTRETLILNRHGSLGKPRGHILGRDGKTPLFIDTQGPENHASPMIVQDSALGQGSKLFQREGIRIQQPFPTRAESR